jgi:hypothetical protein
MEHNKGKKQSPTTDQFDLLMDNVKGYIETRIELVKLETQSKAGNAISVLITSMGLVLFGSLASIFLFIFVALFLGDFLGKTHWGFLIVACFFVVLVLLYKIFHIQIGKYLTTFIDNQIKERSEQENTTKEDVAISKEQEELSQKNLNEMSESELSHLKLADNEELPSIQQQTSNIEEQEKTIFAPKTEE